MLSGRLGGAAGPLGARRALGTHVLHGPDGQGTARGRHGTPPHGQPRERGRATAGPGGRGAAAGLRAADRGKPPTQPSERPLASGGRGASGGGAGRSALPKPSRGTLGSLDSLASGMHAGGSSPMLSTTLTHLRCIIHGRAGGSSVREPGCRHAAPSGRGRCRWSSRFPTLAPWIERPLSHADCLCLPTISPYLP